MLETLLEWERSLFLTLNNFQTPLLDNALWLYSGWIVWIPWLFAFFFALIYKKPLRVWLPVVCSLLVLLATCLLVSDVLFKPNIARFRPTYHPDFINDVKTLFGYKGEGLYGFISGHTTFSFAFATFTALLFRYRYYTWTVALWAVVMAYSRIYLGVHFLTDIAGGLIAGLLVGVGVFYTYKWFLNKYIYTGIEEYYRSFYSVHRKMLITVGLLCYSLFFMVFSEQIVGLLER
ncbi:phosphatase PAP2 family protein [Bacteroides sp. 214]|uniref:phosphatase PAP2 family protein n=1 Tax=Bacteroides sp. 214 TaxID=2302935 RepID=UPI0013D3177D|nr:phosphatase PAP2 family protein [Bacteroides sp. 214]NDW12388.1 phosphatase PAP2 family protein [Bacteroides sp. 214]